MALPTRYVLFLTVLLLLKNTCEAQIVKHKTHLQISNYMETELTIHCKSKDNDIGVKTLPPQGSYAFSFRPNFWNSTLFFCKFTWKDGSHWFDIYVQTRDQHSCVKNCNWFVVKNGSGVCRLIEGEAHLVDMCYPWNDASHAESSHH
ncbi:putative plant self-incompatibility S1 [Rosa chinensis]|uniref:S-protein homolog n=1 Tax=Rosa chinensis TaxID=74649 RepID=A0A2P6RHH5_ROSCH|nr:putative plant self-incompatibility S1 [Rosa chinensis]